MPRKKYKVPTLDDFRGNAAREYHEAKWMAREQGKTTARALALLQDERIGGEITPENREHLLVLDVGCGGGFSTRVLIDAGFLHVVGIDISVDMLLCRDSNFPAILADMTCLPFRAGTFDALISISAMNFISQEMDSNRQVFSTYSALIKEFKRVAKAGFRLVSEFYPKNEGELRMISKAFGESVSGLCSFLVIDGKGTRKTQHFIIARDPSIGARTNSDRSG